VRLTQEELAQAAGISTRAVSDLERGVNRTAHKDTARLLAAALGLREQAAELLWRLPAGGPGLRRCWPPGRARRQGRLVPRRPGRGTVALVDRR
jgi:transcriptional regulator with XRE-family HTH domain